MNMNGLKITWLGHASLLLATPSGTRILVDPWLKGNPSCPEAYFEVESDVILVTHGHADHVGSLFESVERCSGPLVVNAEMAGWAGSKGVDGGRIIGMNKGGTVTLPGTEIRVTMTNAHHSSSFTEEDGTIVYLGEPAGFVVEVPGCPTVYIAGDTCVFGDMSLIAELYAPAIAVLPIGDHFTMGPREAAVAMRLLGARAVVPYHYETFPLLTGTAGALGAELEKLGLDATVMSGPAGSTFG
jgi:L-ascorbate metabolism protein UlaG (beta-lactamase superfamily)